MMLLLATFISILCWFLIPFAFLGGPGWSAVTFIQPLLILVGVGLTWRWVKGRDFWDFWDLGWVAKVLMLGFVYAALTIATNLFAVTIGYPWTFAQRARAACIDDLQNATSMSALSQSGPRGYYVQSRVVFFEHGSWMALLSRSFRANGWVSGYYCLTLDSSGKTFERWSPDELDLPPIQDAANTALATASTTTLSVFYRQLEERGFTPVALSAETIDFKPDIAAW